MRETKGAPPVLVEPVPVRYPPYRRQLYPPSIHYPCTLAAVDPSDVLCKRGVSLADDSLAPRWGEKARTVLSSTNPGLHSKLYTA